MDNNIGEDLKILEEIIKGNEDCINAIYSQMKIKDDNDEDIQYYKKEIQSIKNIVNYYLKEKARADKLEKEYSKMLTELDEYECLYENFISVQKVKNLKKEIENLIDNSQGCMLEEDLHKEYGKIEACDELLKKGKE